MTYTKTVWSTGDVITQTKARNWEDGIEALSLAPAAPITSYAVTRADAVNTTSETDVVTFTVPASTWADGDVVEVFGWFLLKNNKGSTGLMNLKMYLGGVALTQVETAQADKVAERVVHFRNAFQRVGTKVWAMPANIAQLMTIRGWFAPDWFYDNINNFDLVALEWTPTFTNDIIIKWSVSMAAAHASFYVKPQACRAWKIGA